MINKKEFDLLLNQIIQIESKIEEIKILNKFDEAKDFETQLEIIKLEAKDIELDSKNSSEGFDDISSKIFKKLLLLDSEIEYYVLKTNNTIENTIENEFDREAIEKVGILWDSLEKDVSIWVKNKHNPIEELEFKKHIGKMTLDNIIYQLQVEAVLDFTKAFKYCEKEYLLNAIKENLYEGAKNEFGNDIKRNLLTNKAKSLVEEDIYDYKLWQEILMIRNVRSRENHIEMIGSIRDIDNRKFKLEDGLPEDTTNYAENKDNANLYILEDDSIIKSIKDWFYNFKDNTSQKKMQLKWGTHKGPAFQYELTNGDIRYSEKHLDNNAVENSKSLYIASNGISKYNLDKNSNWTSLEKLEFLNGKNTSSELLSPDKTYNCIGNNTFSNSPKLSDISFGKIEIIGNNAFENCINIKELVFSENLMNIGEDAFKGCINLNKVTFLGDLKLYILQRPQNVINCFRDTNLEEIVFANIEAAFNFAITDCPNLKTISVSNISNIKIPFKTSKYKLGRQEGIVSFVGENALNLWKKRNSNVRFYEL